MHSREPLTLRTGRLTTGERDLLREGTSAWTSSNLSIGALCTYKAQYCFSDKERMPSSAAVKWWGTGVKHVTNGADRQTSIILKESLFPT